VYVLLTYSNHQSLHGTQGGVDSDKVVRKVQDAESEPNVQVPRLLPCLCVHDMGVSARVFRRNSWA
jgi:hypothetical protein